MNHGPRQAKVLRKVEENKAEQMAATLSAERASDDLRRQLGVILDAEGALTAILPLESTGEAELAIFQELPGAGVVLSPARAGQLGLAKTENPIFIPAEGLSLAQLRALADPLAEKTALPALSPAPASEKAALALVLTKQAALLPALLIADIPAIPAQFAQWQVLAFSHLKLAIRQPLIDMLPVADAKLPIQAAENARLYAYRARFGSSVHLALVIGEPAKDEAALVRVHSSCVTGDILGSLRCDCGDQLRLALDIIAKAGSGVLLYLHQEGRGIGIANKLRAYKLQECGMDTYDANLALGFAEDERDFAIAAAILKQLGISRITLLTNNPAKITALKGSGIVVADRVAVVAPSGAHNHNYLKAKAEKTGHLF